MEEIKRIDTKNLFGHENLTDVQKNNSKLNIRESEESLPGLLSFPRRIVLELTNTCNLNCIMCGRNATDFKPSFFDTNWLDYLRPFMEQAEEITLMGWGEPTLHPRFDRFMEFASEYPVRKYILTNGTRLDEISPFLFEYGVDILAISLDGPNEETNNAIRAGSDFDSIVSSLRQFVVRRLFSPVKPHINTVTTLMKRNIRSFPRMVDLAAEMGIEEVKGVYLTAFSKDLESETLFDSPGLVRECFEEAAERADKYNIRISLPHIPGDDPAGEAVHRHCYLAWRDLFIGSDGFQRVCMSSGNRSGHILNASNDPVSGLWNSEYMLSFRKTVNGTADEMTHACRQCYQSSCANWNNRHSFIQTDMDFCPKWG